MDRRCAWIPNSVHGTHCTYAIPKELSSSNSNIGARTCMARHRVQKWTVIMVGHRSSTAPFSGKYLRAVLQQCFLDSTVVKHDHEFRKALSHKLPRYNLGKRHHNLVSVYATIRESVTISSFSFCATIWIVLPSPAVPLSGMHRRAALR